MEYIIAFVLIVLTILYFVFKRDDKIKEVKEEIKQVEMKTSNVENENQNVYLNNKEMMVNSFRKDRDLKNGYIYDNGKYFLFFNEKSIFFGKFDSIMEKNPRIMSKNVEHDVICDAFYSLEKDLIVIALKNSKNLIFFDIIKDDQNKFKLNKINKQIETKRKSDIKEVRISGDYVLTTGSDQDTTVDIYNLVKLNHIETINIGEIQNVHMKITLDDKFAVISTYMYELAVVELARNKKFNHTTKQDEEFLKIQRQKSIGGIKVHIIDYDFSNDNRFFVVSSEDQSVKIFQNQGNISDSKILYDFKIKDKNFKMAEKVSLHVDSYNFGKLNGIVALTYDGDIMICTPEGNVIGIFKKAHDTRIMTLKIVIEDSKHFLISGSKDGKFHIFKLII